MKKIPHEVVENYWLRINTKFDEGEIFRVLKGLYDRQQLIMMYLMVADKNSLNESEHQMLYYLGSFVVQVMLGESPETPEVTEEAWEKARGSNLKMLEFLASEDKAENFRRSMDDVIEANNQADLFRYVVELLMNDPECQRSIREENVWRLFTHLKIVIDCLDKAMAHPS